MITQEDMVRRLSLEVEQESIAKVAQRLNFTAPFISRVVSGQVPVSRRLAEAMGYRRVVRFERINGDG